MPYASSNGVRLYYEEAGKGVPIVFVHEFSGDLRSWETQMRHFSRRYRCIAFNARGYPPSEVPASASKYSHVIAVDDIANLMRRLGIARAHVIGCSMGAYATLFFGLRHPRRALSLTAIGAGAGSDPAKRKQFLRDRVAMERRFREDGMKAVARIVQRAPHRIQLAVKDPRGFREFWGHFVEGSPHGHALTLRGIQARRPTLYSLGSRFAQMKVPTHIVVGDEDDGALGPAVFIKRACPAARLTVVRATGHLVSVEEPDLFNRLTEDFLNAVDSGRWRPRDPRSLNPSTMAKR